MNLRGNIMCRWKIHGKRTRGAGIVFISRNRRNVNMRGNWVMIHNGDSAGLRVDSMSGWRVLDICGNLRYIIMDCLVVAGVLVKTRVGTTQAH